MHLNSNYRRYCPFIPISIIVSITVIIIKHGTLWDNSASSNIRLTARLLACLTGSVILSFVLTALASAVSVGIILFCV